jgi:hypothetical protein
MSLKKSVSLSALYSMKPLRQVVYFGRAILVFNCHIPSCRQVRMAAAGVFY